MGNIQEGKATLAINIGSVPLNFDVSRPWLALDSSSSMISVHCSLSQGGI
jgi:hypothetical protein